LASLGEESKERPTKPEKSKTASPHYSLDMRNQSKIAHADISQTLLFNSANSKRIQLKLTMRLWSFCSSVSE
jgi:hypothetical protein